MSDGIQVFGPSGQLVYANQAAAAVMGYPSLDDYVEGQCDGRHWPAPILLTSEGYSLKPDEFPCVQALQGHTVANQVLHYTDHLHRDRCCCVRALPLQDDTGVMYGLVISQDLTELQTMRQRLEHHTHELMQLLEAAPGLTAYLDQREQHHYANAAYLKAFGRSLADIKGLPLQQVVGPVLYQQLHGLIDQSKVGAPVEACLLVAAPLEQTAYQQVTVIPRHPDAEDGGFYLMLKEITALEGIAAGQPPPTDHCWYALEGADVGIWDWNLVNDTIAWSHQQERLFGLLPGTFDGQPETFLGLVDSRDRPQLTKALHATRQSQTALVTEFRVQLANGVTRWLSHRGQVFHDNQQTPVRLAGIAFDITRQKAAEGKLRQQIARERLIAHTSQEISRSKNLDDILPQVIRTVRTFLEVDRIIIITLHSKLAGEVSYEDHNPNVRSMLAWTLCHTWILKEQFLVHYRQGQPLAIDDVHTQPLNHAEASFLDYFQITADLTVPLLENYTLWGLLSAHHSTPKRWQPEEHRLLETLGTQVMTAIQRDQLHDKLTQANQKLKRVAYLDGLTQVANRLRFEQFLNQEWRRLMREKAPLAVIMADIDHFKAYNDQYGHQAGDECLRQIAGVLSRAIQRPADMVARYGGEEFIIILPKTDLAGATTVAERIRILVRCQGILHQGSTSDHIVTLSLGVAALQPAPHYSPEDLIQAADQALYQAKAAGRDRVMASHQ